jgi:hypothetical protein
MKMQDLSGKVAVVTGASSGIGKAAARLLIAEGVRVVLVARRRERIEALAAELGPNAVALAADVADPVQVASIFDQVRDRFGGLDLLFNNAGLGVNAPFEKSDPGDWTRMIDVNLYGVLHCTHAAIPLLRIERGRTLRRPELVGVQRHQVCGGRVPRRAAQGVGRGGYPRLGNRAGCGSYRVRRQRRGCDGRTLGATRCNGGGGCGAGACLCLCAAGACTRRGNPAPPGEAGRAVSAMGKGIG